MPASATANPAILPNYLNKKKTQNKSPSTPTKSQPSTKDTATANSKSATKSGGKEKMKSWVGGLKRKEG
jgi:hypothetical protein